MHAFATILLLLASLASPRPRAREIGIAPGILPTGARNAITDVAGVKVGQTTLIRGENVRTGVTVILPHSGNLFREKVPAAVFVGNGFGKLMGSTQIVELGELESPIALTSTLNVPRVADALIDWMLALPGNEEVRSINVVVGETNDGQLNDIRGRHVGREEVFAAIRSAGEVVEEGSVGAGTGTVAFGWKGGIGTSSRKLPQELGGWTVGVLVQSNYGGVLTIDGIPVGRALGKYYLKDEMERADGSIMIVIATDAPLDARNLERMGARAIMGLARTGAAGTNGSGDYAIAFSTARTGGGNVPNDKTSPLFLATIEATEEAIYNSMLKATTVGKVEALPIEELQRLMEKR
ncbi:MAG TPA: P1 family peptidase [Thermoanaerobaculia bacterium]